MKKSKLTGVLCIAIISIAFSPPSVYGAARKSLEPMTGVIQSVSSDGKVTNTFYGDNADGWNKPIQIAFNKNEWKLKVEKRDQHRELKQYFHPQETVQNWTELLAVERLVGPMVSQVTPERISKSVQGKAQIESTYPNEIQYSGYSDNKSRFDFVRVIITKDVVFTLTYATRNPVNHENVTKWKNVLQSASVQETAG